MAFSVSRLLFNDDNVQPHQSAVILRQAFIFPLPAGEMELIMFILGFLLFC